MYLFARTRLKCHRSGMERGTLETKRHGTFWGIEDISYDRVMDGEHVHTNLVSPPCFGLDLDQSKSFTASISQRLPVADEGPIRFGVTHLTTRTSLC
jgi:hypothetical protein